MFLIAASKGFGPDEVWIAQDMYNIFIQKTGKVVSYLTQLQKHESISKRQEGRK